MDIRYSLEDSDGNEFEEKAGHACFSDIWDKKFGMWGIRYYPHFNVQPKEAIEFLRDMKKIGFYIQDPSAIVLGGEYFMPTWVGFPSGETLLPAHGWVYGNLTLVRYVHEFPRVIYEYLELKQRLPDAKEFYLLQLAHFTTITRKGTYYGNGHSLIDNTFGDYIKEYRTWQGVEKSCKEKRKSVQAMFNGLFEMESQRGEREMLRSGNGIELLHAEASKAADEKALHS